MIDPLEIQAFADGELGPEDAARIEKEIAADEQATEQLMALRRLKECLQTKVEQVDYEDAWKQAVSRLDDIDKTHRVESLVGKYAWGLCALFFLVILGGGLLNRAGGRSLKTGDVASYVAGLGPTSRAPVNDPKMAFAQRYLNAVLSQSQNQVNSSSITLIGQQPGQTRDGRQIVSMLFRDNRGTFSLLVIPGVSETNDANQANGSYSQGVVGNSNFVSWVQGSYGLVLIGDRPTEDLQAIGEHIKISAPQ